MAVPTVRDMKRGSLNSHPHSLHSAGPRAGPRVCGCGARRGSGRALFTFGRAEARLGWWRSGSWPLRDANRRGRPSSPGNWSPYTILFSSIGLLLSRELDLTDTLYYFILFCSFSHKGIRYHLLRRMFELASNVEFWTKAAKVGAALVVTSSCIYGRKSVRAKCFL